MSNEMLNIGWGFWHQALALIPPALPSNEVEDSAEGIDK